MYSPVLNRSSTLQTHVDYGAEHQRCLSTVTHGVTDNDDFVLHYTGCLEFSQRADFFDNGHVWRYCRNINEAQVKAQNSINTYMRRVHMVRTAINRDLPKALPAIQGKDQGPDNEQTSLVHNVEESLKTWRQSDVYEKGIERVRQWKQSRREYDEDINSPDSPAFPDSPRGARLFYENGFSPPRPTLHRTVSANPSPTDTTRIGQRLPDVHVEQQPTTTPYNLESDVNAYVMRFKKTKHGLEGCDFESPSGKFPDQRLPLSELLDTSRILRRDAPDDEVRYIHIPANNMKWIEKLISNYYREPVPDLGAAEKSHKSRQTASLLSSQFWRGQLHSGSTGHIHSRHMRPMCAPIPVVGAEEMGKKDHNIVLFMPFLHWETDRKREAVARIIDDRVLEQRHKRYRAMEEEFNRHVKAREGLSPETPTRPNIIQIDAEESRPELHRSHRSRQHHDVYTAAMSLLPRKNSVIRFSRYGRLLVDNKLGQFLLDAARLYEAMSTYRDKCMIDKFLYDKAPIHPRRTLDQYRFWTLASTRNRDRDQVVYRGTSMSAMYAHKLNRVQTPKQPLYERMRSRFRRHRSEDAEDDQYQWNCRQVRQKTMVAEDFDFLEAIPESRVTTPRLRRARRLRSGSGTSRYSNGEDRRSRLSVSSSQMLRKKTSHDRCDQCRRDICKISRVVMVDQLWLWIIDEKTILTSFPRRYGVNKRDTSGVHHSIRQRVKSADIPTVYDLAMIIMDECSHVFFDRTKFGSIESSNIPEVLEIFAEAIGRLTHQHITAFQHVWQWTEEASNVYRSPSRVKDINRFHVPLLDINSECKMQNEIKDILEEIDILMQIVVEQEKVFKQFDNLIKSEWIMSRGQAWQMTIYDLFNNAIHRKDDLLYLERTAGVTAKSIEDLLALKQQQAGVVQAWQAARQTEETVRQGRAIMTLTILTIVFLPLSFISSVFGMNNNNFNESWTVSEQFQLMFPISMGVILVVLVVAFSTFLRMFLWSHGIRLIYWTLTQLHIYDFWLYLRDDWSSQSMIQRAETHVSMNQETAQKRVEQSRRDKAKKRNADESDQVQRVGHNGIPMVIEEEPEMAVAEDEGPRQRQRGFFGRRPTRPPFLRGEDIV